MTHVAIIFCRINSNLLKTLLFLTTDHIYDWYLKGTFIWLRLHAFITFNAFGIFLEDYSNNPTIVFFLKKLIKYIEEGNYYQNMGTDVVNTWSALTKQYTKIK